MPHKKSSRSKIIGITMGDPGGIGPEVTLKALGSSPIGSLMRRRSNATKFVLIGSPEIYAENKRLTRVKLPFHTVDCLEESLLRADAINILDLKDDASEVQVGKISLANAVLSFHALEVGAYLAREKVIDALVTASINKEAIQLLSPGFTGHTEYLAKIAKTKKFAMMLAGGPLRIVLVTTHLPLNAVSSAIKTQKVFEKIEIAHAFLKTHMCIKAPKIGVASFNPHAGEGGKIGKEEILEITPAVQKARKKKIDARGPIPADIIFHEAYSGRLDAVIAMYHDQGLGPLKMIAFHSGVNVTLNLPFVRTSPDHGTAFDIAYTNKADPGSMTEAIKYALDLIS
jgi:4-phospho-D-threonate 3-dehydrogenase / 4-phospho-D-erythronate 3-dehydrogenase